VNHLHHFELVGTSFSSSTAAFGICKLSPQTLNGALSFSEL
jgi:hypothetical protein